MSLFSNVFDKQTGASASGLLGAIQYSDGMANLLSDEENLFYDSIGGLLGLGTALPTARAHIVGTSDIVQQIVRSNTVQTLNIAEWQTCIGSVNAFVSLAGFGIASGKRFFLDGGGDTYIYEGVNLGDQPNSIAFVTGGVERFRVNASTGFRVVDVPITISASQFIDLGGGIKLRSILQSFSIESSVFGGEVLRITNVGKANFKAGIGVYNIAAPAQASKIVDPTDLPSALTSIAALVDLVESYGFAAIV